MTLAGRWRAWAVVGFVLVVNIVLRLPAIFQEWPPYTFCDEDLYVLAGAYKMYVTGSWTPTGFLAGGANYYPFTVAARLVTTLTGYVVSENKFLLMSRFLGPVILGATMPLFVVAAVAEVSRRRTAIMFAALFATLSPLALAFSRIVYPDHLILAPAAALTWLCVRISRGSGRQAEYIGAGLLLGLLVSIKYSAAAMVLLVALAHVAGTWNPAAGWRSVLAIFTDRRPWLAALATACLSALMNPALLADPGRLVAALKYHQQHYSSIHIGLETPNGYVYYLEQLSLIAFGVLGAIPLVAGLVHLVRRELRIALPLLLFSAAFIAILGRYNVGINRNIAPVLPVTLALMALGLDRLVQVTMSTWPPLGRREALVAGGLVAVLLIEPAWRDVASLRNDFQPDARRAAAQWVAHNIPAGAPIGHRWGCYAYPFDPFRNPIARCEMPPPQAFCTQYFIVDEWVYEKNGPGNNPLVWSVVSEHHFVNTGGTGYPERRRRQDEFLRDYRLLKRFSPDDHYGPGMRIYERRDPCPAMVKAA